MDRTQNGMNLQMQETRDKMPAGNGRACCTTKILTNIKSK